MAILGTLSLDVSAPTAQLQRDLERAQQMVRESARQMDGIKPVWGIASSLQDELRASRSIFSSYAKSIESDTKGYTPKIITTIEINTADYLGKLQLLEREFNQKTGKLNNLKIEPQVDDRQLTALNAHLTLKEQHLDRVVSKFKSTKIEPQFLSGDKKIQIQVDTEKLTNGISDSIEKGFSKAKNSGLNVFDGIKLSIGQSIGTSVAGALKEITGFDSRKFVSSAAKQVAAPIKLLVTDNQELQSKIAKISADNAPTLDKLGYRLGDAIVAGLENQGGSIKSKINAFTTEFFKNANFKDDIATVTSNTTQGVQSAAKSILNAQSLAPIIEPIDRALTERREKTIRERGIPAALERAQEIIESGKQRNSGNAATEDTKELIIATGGYAGARGLSGKRLQTAIQKEAPEGTKVIWTENKDTDIPEGAKAQAGTKAMALLTSLAKPNIRGYNKDSTEMVAQALAAIEKNPNISIKLIGESGGGFPAEEAAKTLQIMGHKNVSFTGVGTPDFIGGLNAPGNKVISPDEFLGAETQGLYQKLGLAKKTEAQNVLGLKGHPYEHYADAKEAHLTNFIQGKPKKLETGEIDEIQKAADAFSSLDLKGMNRNELAKTADQAYQNLQAINRHVIGSVDGSNKQLKAISKQFEAVYVAATEDPKPMAIARVATNKAKDLYTEFDNNRGVTTATKAQVVVKELREIEKEFDKLYDGSVGTMRRKYQQLSEELKAQIIKFSDPSLAVKGTRIEEKPYKVESQEIVPDTQDIFQEAAEKLAQKQKTRKLRTKSIWDDEPDQLSEPGFVNAPALETNKKNKVTNVSDFVKFERAVDKFDRAVDKFANGSNQRSKGLKFEDPIEGEFVYEEQSNKLKALAVVEQGRGLINSALKPVGQVGAVISGGEDALFNTLPFLKPVKRIMQVAGTAAIGGVIAQNPVGQAAIGATSAVLQGVAGAPIGQIAGLIGGGAQNVLSPALNALPGGAALVQQISAGVQQGVQGGGVQLVTMIAGAIAPYLVAKGGMGVAGAAVRSIFPSLAGNESLSNATSKNILGASKVVKQLMPVTTIEPFWDVEATRVEDKALPFAGQTKALPPSKKTSNPDWAAIVEAKLQKTIKNVEDAIKSGEAGLAREYQTELKQEIGYYYKLINVTSKNPDATKEDLAQLNSMLGNLKKKSNIAQKMGGAITELERDDVTPEDIKGKIGWSQKLKRAATQGIKRNMGHVDEEGGFSRIESVIMGLIGAAAIPVTPVVAPVAIGASLIGLLKNSKFAKSELGQTRVPGLDFLDDPLSRVSGGMSKISPNPKRSDKNSAEPLTKEVDLAESALSRLTGAGKLVLGGLAGFTALSLGVPAMIALGKATFDTAANFERLQVKLAGATDSAASGKAQFAKLSNTADRMGISRSTALETGASVLGTTFGTELEGGISDKINTQILQLGQSRGLSQVESKGTLLALKQMLGKSRISTEEINQLTESGGISDARAIGARSLGMSSAQFTKTLEGSTGIDSKSFVQKFLAQANQDALSGQALAQNSIGFKQERAGAAIERTSGTIGAVALTPVKAALDLFTSALDLLNKGLEKSAGLLIGVGVASLGMLGQAAITSGTALNSSIMMVSQSIKGLNLSAGSMAQSFGKMAVQMGLIAVAGETLRLVADQFKNVSQDLIDATGRIGQATRDANISKDKQIEGKPQTADQIGGKDWAESALLGFQRGYRALDNAAGGVLQAVTGKRFEPTIDTKEKEANDRTVAIGDFLTKSQSVRAQTEPTIEKSKGLKQIDLELNTLDTERSGLFANGDADQGKVSELNKRYQAKIAERDKLNQDITPQKTDVQEAINAAKGELKNLEEQFGKGQIAQPQYVSAITSIRAEIKALEADQIKLNEAIKSGFDNLTPWLTSLAKIAAKFEDIGIAANTSKERFAVARNNAEIGGRVTRGGSERQSVEDNDRITEAEIKARKSAISEMESKLNALNPSNIANVRKDYNLTESSSSAEIKVALGGASSASDKVTLEKLAVIKDEQLKVASLDAGLSNSHAETYRRIFAENREAALYYTSLAQQVDPNGAAFAKSIANISTEKNKFMSKLNNYGSSGFDAYATAVIELMDVAKDRMTALAKLASDKKAAIDAENNRKNETEGKNLNAFDSVPGSIKPSKPFTTSGKTPKPKVQKNKTTKVSKSVTTSPYTAEIPSGYSPQGALAGQFAAGVKNLSPVERDRFLNTTLSVNGKTDLGLDAQDRKNPVLMATLARKKAEKAAKGKALKAAAVKPVKTPKVKVATPPKSKITKPNKPQATSLKLKAIEGTDPYINILSAPQFKETKAPKTGKVIKPTKAPKAPISINSAKPAKAVRLPKPKGTGAGGRVTTVDFNNASQGISGMIANQAINQSQNDFAVSEGNNKLREQQAIQKLEKDGRLAQQAADKLIRDNELAAVTATATPSIQSQQRRETLQQQASFTDTRNDIANKGYDMASGINNAQVAIDTLAAIQNRNPEQESAYRKAMAAMPAMVASLQQLQDQQARLPEIEAAAAAQLAKNQAYALEVSKENEQQERRRAEKGAVQTKLTGVQQQISLTPLDQNKLLEARKLESDIANRQTEIDKVAAERVVADRARQDDSYSPAAQAEDARRIAADQANNRKNIKDKQAGDSIKSGRTARDEALGNQAAELKLTQSGEAQVGRVQQANDKIDAPFANTISLESDLKQKLIAIEVAKQERLKTLTQMKEKFAGTSAYNAEQLASIERQEKEAERQSNVEKSIVEIEAGVSIRSVQKDRRGYLKGQEQQLTSGKIALYDSQTNATKQQGGDVTDREFKSNVAKRMEDTNIKVFDLEQQRSMIVGETVEANAAREAIDKLIASHYALEQSDLSNMASAYDKFNQVLGDTQKTAMGVLETFVKTGKFDWRALLISPLESSIKQLLGNVVPNLFSGLFRKVEAPAKREGVVDSIVTNTKPSLNEFYSKPSLGDGVKIDKPEGDSPYATTSAKPELVESKGILPNAMAPTKPLDMVEIPIPNGGTYKVTRQQAISEGFIDPKKEVRPDKPKPEVRKPEGDELYLNKVAAPLPVKLPTTPTQSIGTAPIGKKSASSEMVDITMQDGTVKQMTRAEAIFNGYMSANEVTKPKLEIPNPIGDAPFVQSNKQVAPVIKKSQPAIQQKVEKAIEQKADDKFDNDLNNFNFDTPEEPKEVDRKWIKPQVIDTPKPKKEAEGRLKKTDTIMFSGGGAPAVEIPWGEKKEVPTPELEIKPFKPQTIDPPEVTIRDYDEVKGKGENLLKGTDLDNNYNKMEIIPAPSKILDPSRPMIPFDGLEKRSAAPRQGNSLGGGILNVASSLISGKGVGGVLGSLGGLFGLSFADGGIVPNDSKFNKFREGDNPVANALRKEGTNSVIAALTPGERVLTVSESKYYQTMFPKGIKNFKDGGVVGEIKPVAMALDQRKIDTRGDSNEFNFNISDASGSQKQSGMSKSDIKDFENAVTAVMLKHKRARTGLTG